MRLMKIIGFMIVIGCVFVPVVAQDRTHTVQPGETLASIAARYNVTVESLVSYNNITNPNYIRRGQELLIPPTGGPYITGPTQVYVVQPGDTLADIARRFDTTVESLVASNPNIGNQNRITTGLTITVPQQVVQQPPVIQPRRVVNGFYTVQRGDTMLAIARDFGVDVWNLARTNGIYNLNLIYVGQALRVPGY